MWSTQKSKLYAFSTMCTIATKVCLTIMLLMKKELKKDIHQVLILLKDIIKVITSLENRRNSLDSFACEWW